MSGLSVTEAISIHRALVSQDATYFDEQGDPIGEKGEMDASDSAMSFAWLQIMKAPCLTLDDVRAKVDYVLHGPNGERAPLIENLTVEDGSPGYVYGNCLPTFLESLIVPAPEVAA